MPSYVPKGLLGRGNGEQKSLFLPSSLSLEIGLISREHSFIVVLKARHFPEAQKYSGPSRLGWFLSPSSSAAEAHSWHEEKEGARESLHPPLLN